jgi:hypothetical protein
MSLALLTGAVIADGEKTRRSSSDAPSPVVDAHDFKCALEQQLSPIRKHFQTHGQMHLPAFTFRRVDTKTSAIEMDLPSGSDSAGILSAWLHALSGQQEPPRIISQGGTLTLISSDQCSSILLRKESISLFKDNFAKEDAAHIAKGYESACLRARSNSPDRPSFRIVDPEDMFDILGGRSDFAVGGTAGAAIPAEYRNMRNVDPNKAEPGADAAVNALEKMGLRVYGISDSIKDGNLNWESLAGYQDVKKDIEDTVISALRYPKTYDDVAKLTRKSFHSGINRPKAVLFSGPPGTGKTLSARIIAAEAGRPMIHLPFESVVSKVVSFFSNSFIE